MKNKWNLFWEDYLNLYGDSCRFLRKHWVGTLLYAFVCVTVFIFITADTIDRIVDWFDDLIQKVKSKFKKTE